MKKIPVTKIELLDNVSEIPSLARTLGWSEGAVWDLIRMGIVKWGVYRGNKSKVVVSKTEVMAWVGRNTDTAMRLTKPVSFLNPYALTKKRRS